MADWQVVDNASDLDDPQTPDPEYSHMCRNPLTCTTCEANGRGDYEYEKEMEDYEYKKGKK